MRQLKVSLNVLNEAKSYSLLVKVIPTDDIERYSHTQKFAKLLQFSKEVQVYHEIVRPMFRYIIPNLMSCNILLVVFVK